MLHRREKVPLFSKAKKAAFPAVFLALALLATAGWLYWLGSISVKFILWCFGFFT
jgi:hypothetical protein